MSDRTQRILLWTMSGLCLAAGVGVVSASLWVPTEVSRDAVRLPPAMWIRPPRAVSEEATLDEQDFQFVWGKLLQRPLVDLSSPEEKKPAEIKQPSEPQVPKVRLDAKLVGTLVDAESAYARAWIELKGKSRMVALGDILDGHKGNPVVASIKDREVVVMLDEESHTLVLDETSLLVDASTRQPEEGQRAD